MPIILKHDGDIEVTNGSITTDGNVLPANDSATPTIVNRFWSGTQAQYDELGTYDANTLYYIV